MTEAADIDRVRGVVSRVRKLSKAGRLTREEFRRAWSEVEAAQGDEKCTEALMPFAESLDWLPGR